MYIKTFRSARDLAFSYGLYYCQDATVPGVDTTNFNFVGKGKIPLDYMFYDNRGNMTETMDTSGMPVVITCIFHFNTNTGLDLTLTVD